MGSAIGNMGVAKFEPEAKTPQTVKVTFAYIAALAGAIGEVTGDPQLKQIAQGLGSVAPAPIAPGAPV